MNKAVFPGTFDPITLGHVSIIQRALPLFDELIIAIGINPQKQHLFSLEKRLEWIQNIFKKESKVSVKYYEGLTVDYCHTIDAKYILRGLRSVADFDYEHSIAQMNKVMANDIETVFLLTDPQYAAISSTIVRDIIKNNGNACIFLPKQVDYRNS